MKPNQNKDSDLAIKASRLVRFRKWFFHDIMGWHNCKGGNGSFDGCSHHAKCSCGKEVMQDGQGNWF